MITHYQRFATQTAKQDGDGVAVGLEEVTRVYLLLHLMVQIKAVFPI